MASAVKAAVLALTLAGGSGLACSASSLDQCGADADCPSHRCQAGVCVAPATPPMCSPLGSPCASDPDCCAGDAAGVVACTGGICVDPPAGPACVALHAGCTPGGGTVGCCQADTNGVPVQGGVSCSTSTLGYSCERNGQGDPSDGGDPATGCRGAGESCAGPTDCCSMECGATNVCSCQRAAFSCTLDSECCSGTCLRVGPHPRVCCYIGGVPCVDDSECCSGHCSSGTHMCRKGKSG